MAQTPKRSVADELAAVRVALNQAMNELSLAEFLMERAKNCSDSGG
jgi:hypothetical protein